MKKAITIVLFFISFSGYTQSQHYIIDTTFKPYFDIRNQISPNISDIYESNSRKLYLTGHFEIAEPSNNQIHKDLISINTDGSRNKYFSGTYGGGGIIQALSDSVLLNGNKFYGFIDTFGYAYNQAAWYFKYRKSVNCSTGTPYFFKDGSALFANGSNNSGLPCPIINPPDTFLGRHIIKLNPQGLWDSTFVPDANEAPWGIVPYDSNRLFIYGKAFQFTHYNGVRVNGLCRIYLDGSLDTTFTSPISDSIAFNAFYPHKAEKNGDFFLTGQFLLKKYPHQYLTLVRCHADGSLDSTFMNLSGPTDTLHPVITFTGSAVQTEDGGYLVGGHFNSYQGYAKNCIAKIDSNGKVEPQYFTGIGPDSAIFLHQKDIVGVGKILKSKYGGYYLLGNFLKWDGKPVQPIIRLKLVNTTGIKENETVKTKVKVYPNPTNDKITIQSSATIKTVEILDLLGKRIQFHLINNANSSFILDLSHLSQGIYLLSIHLENGESLSKKVVKN